MATISIPKRPTRGRPSEAIRWMLALATKPGKWEDKTFANPATAADRARKMIEAGAEVEVIVRARVVPGRALSPDTKRAMAVERVIVQTAERIAKAQAEAEVAFAEVDAEFGPQAEDEQAEGDTPEVEQAEDAEPVATEPVAV